MAIQYTMSVKKPSSSGTHVKIQMPAKPNVLQGAISAALGGPPAAASPAPSSATSQVPAGGSSQPVDPQLDADLGIANRNRSQQMISLAAERSQLGSTYGFGENAQGGVYDDPSNPFSRAAVMQLMIDRSKLGAATSMGARGQLYAGAFQDEQSRLTGAGQQSRDALIREFLAASGSITQRELQSSNAFDDAGSAARAASIQRTLANRPDPASVAPYAAPVDTTYAATAGAVAAPADYSAAKADGVKTAAYVPAKPKPGYQFVQDSGSRAGQSYNLVQKDGNWYRFYANGDKVLRP